MMQQQILELTKKSQEQLEFIDEQQKEINQVRHFRALFICASVTRCQRSSARTCFTLCEIEFKINFSVSSRRPGLIDS